MSITETPWYEPVPDPPADAKPPARLLTKERRLRALEMRRRGHHWQEIADTCGYASAKSAANAVAALTKKTVLESVDDYRQMQIDRCHEMLVALGPKVDAGNERAIETSLRVLDKLDKLVGTERAHVSAEVQHTHKVVIDTNDEEGYVAQLRALAPPARPATRTGGEVLAPNPWVDDEVIDVDPLD